MGFFSFLTRKSSTSHDCLEVKSQAYNCTVASVPPIRGTYPVAGNGPNVLDQLQQAARKRSQAQLATISNGADPSSFQSKSPRFLGFSGRRPGTAPGNRGPESRPRSFTRSIRSSRSAVGVSDLVRYTQDRPPVPSIPLHHRHSSVDSFHDNRSIDILDAQDDIRPSQFHSRVRASGAREFGEDVAERNLGFSARNVADGSIETFYAVSSNGQLMLQASNSGSGVEFVNHILGPQEESEDDSAPPPGIPKGDLARAQMPRHRPSSAATWKPFPTLEVSRPSRPRSQVFEKRLNSHAAHSMQDMKALKVDRRRSFNAFASAANGGQSRPRPLSLHQSYTNLQYNPSSPPPMPRSRPKTSEGRAKRRSSARFEHDNMMGEELEPPLPLRNDLSWSSPTREPSMPSLPRGRSRQPVERHRSRSVTKHNLPIHSAFTRTELPTLSRPSSSSSMEVPRPRTRSNGGASLPRRRLDDITEHIPVRTSSLTHQTISCATPSTTSTAFSNSTFPQAANPETPRSSADEAFPPSIKFDKNRMSMMSYHSPIQTKIEREYSAGTLAHSSDRNDNERNRGPMPMKDGVQLDHYLSDGSQASIDSFVAWKGLPPVEDGLLFEQDVYSGLGAGLPGLFDPPLVRKSSQASSKPPVAKNSPRRPSTRSSHSTPRKSKERQKTRRSRASTFSSPIRHARETSFDSSADSDTDSFWEKKRDRSTGLGFVSLAELGIDIKETGLDMYGLTEGDDAKVDISTAIRLRKEMKRRKLQTNYRNRLLQQAKAEVDSCLADAEN